MNRETQGKKEVSCPGAFGNGKEQDTFPIWNDLHWIQTFEPQGVIEYISSRTEGRNFWDRRDHIDPCSQ